MTRLPAFCRADSSGLDAGLVAPGHQGGADEVAIARGAPSVRPQGIYSCSRAPSRDSLRPALGPWRAATVQTPPLSGGVSSHTRATSEQEPLGGPTSPASEEAAGQEVYEQ
jgi:hypothetical protein